MITETPKHVKPTGFMVKAYSHNGYEREEALKELKENVQPKHLPIFLSRINDWVPSVQCLAEQGLLALLRDNPILILKNLDSIYRIKSYRRRDHTELWNKILTLLRQAELTTELTALIFHKNQKLGFLAAKLSTEEKLLSEDNLFNLGINSSSLYLGRFCINKIHKDNINLESATLLRLNQHNFSPLRKLALTQASKLYPEDFNAIAAELLNDTNADIRKLAQKSLQMEQKEIYQHYSKLYDHPNTTLKVKVLALSELYESDREKSHALLNENLTHPIPKLRKLSLQLLSNNQPEVAKNILLAALFDQSDMVANEASRLSNKLGIFYSRTELLMLSRSNTSNTNIKRASQLARKGGKWSQLILLLHMFIDNQQTPPLKILIEAEFQQWLWRFNLSGTSRTTLELEEISELLIKIRKHIPNSTFHQHAFLIES